MLKGMGCAQGRKNAKSKHTQNTQNYKIQNLQNWWKILVKDYEVMSFADVRCFNFTGVLSWFTFRF